MRKIKEIIIHSTATPEGRETSVEDIRSWHKQRGWSDIGYHFVVQIDGSINRGRPVNISGAHCKGKNKSSIGVVYVGGCDSEMKAKDTRTQAQIDSLEYLVGYLCATNPGAEVFGHRDFSPKECPCYDATSEYKSIADKYGR